MKLNIKNTLLMFSILSLSCHLMAFEREYLPKNAFIFSFKEKKVTLQKFKTNNNIELDFMKLAIHPNLKYIRSGQDHLRIVSYVGKNQGKDTTSLCDAFLQASLVRLYLSAEYEIPKNSYTFYVDTIANKSNMVSVELINFPIGEGDQNSLYYTLNESPVFHKTVMEMYEKIPYLDSEKSFSQEYFVENVLKQYSTLLRNAIKKQSTPVKTAPEQHPSQMDRYLFEKGQDLPKGLPRNSEYIVSSYGSYHTPTYTNSSYSSASEMRVPQDYLISVVELVEVVNLPTSRSIPGYVYNPVLGYSPLPIYNYVPVYNPVPMYNCVPVYNNIAPIPSLWHQNISL